MTSGQLPEWLPKRFMTVREVAEVLQISERQVRRFIKDQRLPVSRLNRLLRIEPESVFDLMEQD